MAIANKTSLAKFISDYFEVPCGSKDFLYIYSSSLKYLTKTITAGTMHKRIKTVTNKSVKVFRLQLVNVGYYLLNVKMWLIHSYANKRNPKWNGRAELDSMGIMKYDKLYLPQFVSDPELRSQVKAMMFQLGGKVGIPTIKSLKETLIKVVQLAEVKLKPLINNLLWTKLKFLVQCGSLDFESVKGELKAKMIQTFYWLAPYRKESINHWVMSMIKPIKNHAINLINFHTTQKRTRMIEENGVYKVVETSVDSVEEDRLGDMGAVVEDIESKIVAQQLIDRYGITAKRITAFKLMAGVYDEKFTTWLKEHQYISNNSNFDNTDFQEQVRNKFFLKLVARYVKLNWLYFKNLILSIRFRLQEGGTDDHVWDSYGQCNYAAAAA
jgi:hypothetical protein